MADTQNSRILLESGTNEIEIMKFTIAENLYGINVAKVREIMISEPVKPMPHAHPAVEGIFKPRDAVLTVVDLPRYLGVESEKKPKDILSLPISTKCSLPSGFIRWTGSAGYPGRTSRSRTKPSPAALKAWLPALPNATGSW